MGTIYRRKGQNKWYGRWVDENGSQKYKVLSVDKGVSRTMLSNLERSVERRLVGLDDKYMEHARQPLTAHLEGV